MDNIEKLVTEFRNELHQMEPLDGHFERFELRLNKKRQIGFKSWSQISTIAAVSVLFLIIASLLLKNIEKSESASIILPQNIIEIQHYYTLSIDKQLKTLRKHEFRELTEKPTIERIEKEISEYDKTFAQICSELQATPNDERVIGALVSYYQTKLEILTKINNELNLKK